MQFINLQNTADFACKVTYPISYKRKFSVYYRKKMLLKKVM